MEEALSLYQQRLKAPAAADPSSATTAAAATAASTDTQPKPLVAAAAKPAGMQRMALFGEIAARKK